MASSTKAFMSTIVNCANDLKREVLQDIINVLETKGLLTDDIKTEIMEMLGNIKVNKKVKKESKPRFSGYHLFMKEHRVVVKEENPGIKPQELTTIVSRAWKHISEEDKENFNSRSRKMKEEYESSSSSETEAKPTEKKEKKEPAEKKEKKEKKEPAEKKEKKEKKEKEKKEPVEKKEKKEKKENKEKKDEEKKAPTPPSSESDDDADITIENADSDIEI
jgi:outer membrane biosynthesis protein TonB